MKDIDSQDQLWVLWAEKGAGYAWWRASLLQEDSGPEHSCIADSACKLSFFFPASVYTNSDQVANSSPLLSATGCRTENTCSRNGLISPRLAATARAWGHMWGEAPAALSAVGSTPALGSSPCLPLMGLIHRHKSERPCSLCGRLSYPTPLLCVAATLKQMLWAFGKVPEVHKWAWWSSSSRRGYKDDRMEYK